MCVYCEGVWGGLEERSRGRPGRVRARGSCGGEENSGMGRGETAPTEPGIASELNSDP